MAPAAVVTEADFFLEALYRVSSGAAGNGSEGFERNIETDAAVDRHTVKETWGRHSLENYDFLTFIKSDKRRCNTGFELIDDRRIAGHILLDSTR